MMDWLTPYTGALPNWLEHLIVAALALAIGVSLAVIAHRIVFRVLQRIVSASRSKADDVVTRRLMRPSRYAFVALGVVLAAREVPALQGIWERVAGFVMPAMIGWIALALLHSMIESMYLRADISVADNRNARRRRTRLAIFGRIGTFLIVFLTISLMLFSIPGVQQIGVTLMASAGLAALAVGAAAQPALKALIGGFQMALTEPISIDDVVVLDGEWGRIEDIRTTYVVVRLWDERRLVVPSNRFLEDTFQNWTKRTSELLGTVEIWLDPTADIAPIRSEFERQIKANPRWDQRAQVVQVTNANADAIEVRFLMSARDGPTMFDLRCDIREGMLAWIREHQPEALVRRRVEATAPVELAAENVRLLRSRG